MTPAVWTAGRRLVPRWRSLRATLTSLELAQPKPMLSSKVATAAPAPDPDFLARLERWQLHPSLVTAAEFLEAAIVEGDEKVAVSAARQLIQVDKNAAPLIHAQAASVLVRHGYGDEVPREIQFESMPYSPRHGTRMHPRDPLAWVELALRQVSRGHADAAKRSMRVALAIAPSNRHVLRSAARLFLHADTADRAHDLILRNPATKYDPWLIAAEIALAEVAKRSPRFHKQGQRMLEDRSGSARQLTELAGAIATDEYLNGSRKKARRNFAFSMLNPTGSALAQGEWASIQTGMEVVSESNLSTTPEAAEARAFHLHRIGDYASVPEVCIEWSKGDSFSIRPFSFGSSLAGLVGNHDAAIELAQKGLALRPDTVGLLNAMAFSLASMDRPSEAAEFLLKVPTGVGGSLRCLTLANWGLIAFRSGDTNLGQRMYQEAIDGFSKLARPDMVARARIYLAREAVAAKIEGADRILVEAKQAAKGMKHDENDFVLRQIEGLAPAAVRAARSSTVPAPKTVIATFPSGEKQTFLIHNRT